MPNLKSKKATTAGNNPPVDLRPSTTSPEDVAMENNANVLIIMHAQSYRRKAGNLAKYCLNCQSPQLNSTTNPNDNLVP